MAGMRLDAEWRKRPEKELQGKTQLVKEGPSPQVRAGYRTGLTGSQQVSNILGETIGQQEEGVK